MLSSAQAVLLAMTLAGCSTKTDGQATRGSGADTSTIATAASSSSSQRQDALDIGDTSTAVPTTWGPIRANTEAKVKPTLHSFAPSKSPTMVIFFATWCAPCVASIQSDVDLRRRYAPKTRVGLMLVDDSDEKFLAFAEHVKASLDIEVWRDDEKTRELAKNCEARTIPRACLLDGRQNIVWQGAPSEAAGALAAFEAGTLAELEARGMKALEAIREAQAAPDDAGLRAKAVAEAHNLANLENSAAWDMVETGKSLDLSVALARDASIATGGMDFAILDTYAFGLWKVGRKEDALAVATRLVAVCDSIEPKACREERGRYERFKSELGR